LYPNQQVDLNRYSGASNSSIYIGKGFRLYALEPDRIAKFILLKTVHVEDSRPSFYVLCLLAIPLEAWHLMIGSSMGFLSTSVDVTFWGTFLFGCLVTVL